MAGTAQENVVIKNIYYMMAYAFRALDLVEFRRLQTEEFDNFQNLLAAILVLGINDQRRRGFERDYIPLDEDLKGVRGRIDMRRTVQLRMAHRQEIGCAHDEYLEDTCKNRILKCCAKLLVADSAVDSEHKVELRRCLRFLHGVSSIEANKIEWSRLRYHRNNGSYQILMNVCYLIVSGCLLTTQEGEHRLAHYLSKRSLDRLYEKFLLEYFKREHRDIHATAKQVKDIDDEVRPSFVPALQTDLALECGQRTLIVDAKCYGTILSAHFDNEILNSSHVHEIFHYVVRESAGTHNAVEGMLLYAGTRDERPVEGDWHDAGFTLRCKTLDLSQDFAGIRKQLDGIANLLRT